MPYGLSMNKNKMGENLQQNPLDHTGRPCISAMKPPHLRLLASHKHPENLYICV